MPSKWLEQTRIAFFRSVKHVDHLSWIEIEGKTSKTGGGFAAEFSELFKSRDN